MALASWLRGVRLPKGDTKPGKVQHFGANFDGTLFLETTTLRPYAKLRGRLCVETRFMLKFHGIHVQLEADLYIKFTSQNGRHVYRKRVCILENTEIRKNGDQLSPIRDDVVPPVPVGKELVVVISPECSSPLGMGTHYSCENFIFTLNCPGEPLPQPFKNNYGSLTYKVVAYMRSIYDRYVQVAETPLTFDGYLNLHGRQDLLNPVKIKRGLLDVSANVQAILVLDNGAAYLSEESVPFKMIVRNPGCIPLQIVVFIAQKITYNVDGVKLAICSRVDQVELFEHNPEADTLWKGTLTIPKDQPCSYHDKNPAYDIRYAIQFKVHVENHGILKGTQELIVGTTRESPEQIKTQVHSLQVPTNPWAGRRGSNSSIKSEGSYRGGCYSAGGGGVRKKASLPSYSQVNSPVKSVESLHPPPSYLDDIDFADEEISIPVPSTSSSTRGSITEE